MRTFTLLILFISVGFTLLSQNIKRDPFLRTVNVGGSSDLFLIYSDDDKSYTKYVAGEPLKTLDDVLMDEPRSTKFLDVRKISSCKGDFNNDGIEDVVFINNATSGGMQLTIPAFVDQSLQINPNDNKTFRISDIEGDEVKQVRLCAGNFDEDPEMEFVLCYGKETNDLFYLRIFETNADLEISEVTSSTSYFFNRHFDVCAADVNNDGIDEIFIVKNSDQIGWNNQTGNNRLIETQYWIDSYQLVSDDDSYQLQEFKSSSNQSIDNPVAHSHYGQNVHTYHYPVYTNLRIASGDIYGGQGDEIVVAVSVYYQYTGTHNCFQTYMHTFTVEDELEHKEQITVAGYGNSGNFFAAPETQHLSQSLACVNLDSDGKDEVLINSCRSFHLFRSTVNSLVEDVNLPLYSYKNHMSITGNETFCVGGFNPEAGSFDVNKEIILLKTEHDLNNQLNYTGSNDDFVFMEIYQFDKTTESSFTLQAPIEIRDFPNSADNNKLSIASIITGDFNSDGDIFKITSPDTVMVENYEQPILILNSPPVHYDSINGVFHDLCDSYNNNESSFGISYEKETSTTETASLTVTHDWGLSNETNIYALKAGSGFDLAIKGHWDWGKSFYNAETETVTISEEYSEGQDVILVKEISYRLLRYPIIGEDGERKGRLIVTLPLSERGDLRWINAKDWDNTSYLFSHEVGNVLSYSSCAGGLAAHPDVCSESGILVDDISSVPITATLQGRLFRYDQSESSHSSTTGTFKGGAGVNFLVKKGFEGEVSAEPAGVGVSGNVKIGVSNLLNTYYEGARINNVTIEHTSQFAVQGQMGSLVGTAYHDYAEYHIKPFIYRSNCGALVVDYHVTFDGNQSGWWTDNYGDHVDFSFIKPWRFAKTNRNLHRSTDIQFYPAQAMPGERVNIIARVHNYSFKPYSGELTLNFYQTNDLGELEPLINTDGASRITKSVSMNINSTDESSDFEEIFVFEWQVPTNQTKNPRIVIKIDENNEVPELKESNNFAWNIFNIYGVIDDMPVPTSIKKNLVEETTKVFTCYPNPVGNSTQFSFELIEPSYVQIDIYSLVGQRVTTVMKQHLMEGKHEIGFDAGGLKPGMYLVVLKIDKIEYVNKFIKL